MDAAASAITADDKFSTIALEAFIRFFFHDLSELLFSRRGHSPRFVGTATVLNESLSIISMCFIPVIFASTQTTFFPLYFASSASDTDAETPSFFHFGMGISHYINKEHINKERYHEVGWRSRLCLIDSDVAAESLLAAESENGFDYMMDRLNIKRRRATKLPYGQTPSVFRDLAVGSDGYFALEVDYIIDISNLIDEDVPNYVHYPAGIFEYVVQTRGWGGVFENVLCVRGALIVSKLNASIDYRIWVNHSVFLEIDEDFRYYTSAIWNGGASRIELARPIWGGV